MKNPRFVWLFGLGLLAGLALGSGSAAAKSPVPDSKTLQATLKQIDDLYHDEVAQAATPKAKEDLARKLLAMGQGNGNEAAERYALLTRAADLAVQAGNPEVAFTADDALAKDFDVDAAKLKRDSLLALGRVLPAPRDAQSLSLFETALQSCRRLIDEALVGDHYDVAQQVAVAATSVGSKSGDSSLQRLSSDWVGEVRDAANTYAKLAPARAKLAHDPTSPEANLAVGRQRCLMCGDWAGEVSLLALGSDIALRTVATEELAVTAASDAQATLADHWWDLGEKLTGPANRRIVAHAAQWYTKALPGLAGLTKTRAEMRIAQAATLLTIQADVQLTLRYVPESPMKPYPRGYKQASLPAQDGDDPLGPFNGHPVFFDERGSKQELMYAVTLPRPAAILFVRGTAFYSMRVEILDTDGKTILLSSGPFNVSTALQEQMVRLPPQKAFVIRIHNEASTWLYIQMLQFR